MGFPKKSNKYYEGCWFEKKWGTLHEIVSVYADLKDVINATGITYKKQYWGVRINGKDTCVIKFRPQKERFFIEIKGTDDSLLTEYQSKLPITFIYPKMDTWKKNYYRIELHDYVEYLILADDIKELISRLI